MHFFIMYECMTCLLMFIEILCYDMFMDDLHDMMYVLWCYAWYLWLYAYGYGLMFVAMWLDAIWCNVILCDGTLCYAFMLVRTHAMMPNDMYAFSYLYMWMDSETKCMECKQCKCM